MNFYGDSLPKEFSRWTKKGITKNINSNLKRLNDSIRSLGDLRDFAFEFKKDIETTRSIINDIINARKKLEILKDRVKIKATF